MAPVMEKLAMRFDGVTFAKFDCGIEDNKMYAMAAGIKALPTFHLYRGAQKVGEMSGAKAKKLKQLLKEHTGPQMNELLADSGYGLFV